MKTGTEDAARAGRTDGRAVPAAEGVRGSATKLIGGTLGARPRWPLRAEALP